MIRAVLKGLLAAAILVLSVLGSMAVVARGPKPVPRPEGRRIPVVRVTTARAEDVRLDVTAFGVVRPRTETTLVAQVAGRVEAVSPSWKSGGFFRKGEVLLRIDARDYELRRTQAEALVARAKAGLDRVEAEAGVARREWQEFGKGEANPLALRKPQLEEAEAQLASARAALKAAELDLLRTSIRAPYDGRVREKLCDVGQFVAAGTPVARIYATDYAEVRLAVPDHHLAFLDLPLVSAPDAGEGPGGAAAGPVVELFATFAGAEHRWVGRIVRTEAEIDPRSRVVHAVARVEKPYTPRKPGSPPLMVGMYVRAVIHGKPADSVILAPPEAVRGRNTVLVVDGEDRLRVRKVEILRRTPRGFVVSRGIRPGERICLTDVRPAVEGMRVKPEETP